MNPGKIRQWLFMISAVIFLWAFIVPVWADGETVLTMEQAVQAALKHSPEAVKAQNDLARAKAKVRMEAWKIFPQASVQGLFKYDVNNETYPRGYVIQVNQTVPTKLQLFGKTIASNLEAAMWDQVYYELQMRVTRAKVVNDTITAYIDVLKAEKVVALAEAAAANAKALSELARAKVRLGQATKTDQLKADSDLAAANYNLIKSRLDLSLAKRKLAGRIGVDDAEGIKCREEKTDLPGKDPDLPKMKEELLERRLEIQQGRINLRKAERIYHQTKNAGLPSVDLSFDQRGYKQSFSAGYNFNTGDLSWQAAYQNKAGVYYDNNNDLFGEDRKFVTLRLTWKLDYGVTNNQTEQERMNLENARIELKQKETEIRLEMEQAVSDYELARMKVESNRQALSYYQQALAVKRVEYRTGGVTLADLSKAEQDLAQAQVELAKSEYDESIADRKLEWTAGRLYDFTEEGMQE